MGFRIFVRQVLILKQSLFQSGLKIKVFFHAREKTTDKSFEIIGCLSLS